MKVYNSMEGKRYDKAIEAGAKRGLEQTCVAIESQAKSFCPVDTGLLKGSIDYALKDRNSGTVSKPTDRWTGHVGTNVEYARYVEDGTQRQEAQPYLRPALDIVRQNPPIGVEVKNEMKKENRK
jgi:HK97 gp10 family phage protein